ncbi:hypothetical protein Fcan01_08916 [Folsomia candida]|uniref:Ig-like domain-containing protein n=2 Tax=Folsomia candida TaxID=158441 RepID=A0A226EFQ6_FOLCA|nr:hypothetical protein Fcan01_08916 [Folsomia candida]
MGRTQFMEKSRPNFPKNVPHQSYTNHERIPNSYRNNNQNYENVAWVQPKLRVEENNTNEFHGREDALPVVQKNPIFLKGQGNSGFINFWGENGPRGKMDGGENSNVILEREEEPTKEIKPPEAMGVQMHETMSTKNLPRRPGLPNDIPLPTINMTNVVALLELANSDPNPEDLTVEQEALVIQTLSQVATFIGLQDVRDWIGIIAMSFVIGPIAIPLFFFPIMLIMMGSFLIPLVINGANVAAANAGGGAARKRKDFNDGHPLESFCTEMLACEASNFLRKSTMSGWMTRAFSLTSVEWAGPISSSSTKSDSSLSYTQEEDCAKYKCKILQPLQTWFSKWYSYIFTYQNDNTAKRPGKLCGRKFKRRCIPTNQN